MITVEQIHAPELLSNLHCKAFDDGWSDRACRDVLAMPGTRCWIANLDEQPAGFLVIRQAADEGEVISTGVLPDFRRQGIAAHLFRAAFGELAGCRSLFLEVSAQNDAASGLYRGLGFREAGRRIRYYSDGSDALVMVR